MSDGMTLRFAEARDTESFAKWAAENRLIDRGDIMAATKEQNPTTTYLVIEKEGVPVMFMPVYMALRIGYLGFNPEAGREQREAAMEMMLRAVVAFAQLYQIGTVDVLTKSKYPVARWAQAHGFNADPRELFILKCGAQAASTAPQPADKTNV
jgi:hypothetical protein